MADVNHSSTENGNTYPYKDCVAEGYVRPSGECKHPVRTVSIGCSASKQNGFEGCLKERYYVSLKSRQRCTKEWGF